MIVIVVPVDFQCLYVPVPRTCTTILNNFRTKFYFENKKRYLVPFPLPPAYATIDNSRRQLNQQNSKVVYAQIFSNSYNCNTFVERTTQLNTILMIILFSTGHVHAICRHTQLCIQSDWPTVRHSRKVVIFSDFYVVFDHLRNN